MNINKINIFAPFFQGKRQDRKAISQLENDNKYDLNVPNQKRISQAIENLSEIPGEDNVKFLLSVADNLKYGTNIDLKGKKSYNDWETKLQSAAQKSLELSDKSVQDKLSKRIDAVFRSQKPLNKTEKEILEARKSILSKVDVVALNKIGNKNIRNLKTNLDYFIVSSEVPISQKLYILNRLKYFMSPDYKINPQLKDKKTEALAEMVNDIVINTPESEIPNIKAINQKSYGICAEISIARKSLAYEDKKNYIDMIMSELDDKDYLEVYDITKLGTNAKVKIQKSPLDFEYAMSKGYRIVDASSMYWMSVANTVGAVNESTGIYSAFDKENFDAFADSHLISDLDDDLVNKQDYYRTLVKAKSVIGDYKKFALKTKYKAQKKIDSSSENIELIHKYSKELISIFNTISPNTKPDKSRAILKELLSLKVANSDRINSIEDDKKDFAYIDNESDIAKLNKIKSYVIKYLPNVNEKVLDEKMPVIMDLLNEIQTVSPLVTKYTIPSKEVLKAEKLYNVAAIYRTQQRFQLDIPEELSVLMRNFNMPDNETGIIENMDMLIKKLKNNSINPELREKLAKNFQTENDNEAVEVALEENKEAVKYITTNLMDDLYGACLSVNRKNALANHIGTIKTSIVDLGDDKILTETATKLGVKKNPVIVGEQLDNIMEFLRSDKCTQEEYSKIHKQFGQISELSEFKETFERLGEALFKEQNEDILKGFNVINGLSADASLQDTYNIYNKIAENFNNLSVLISTCQSALRIVSDNGNVLNTTEAKEIILKKLENLGIEPSDKELKILQDKISKIYLEINNDEKKIKVADLPKEVRTFTPYEKSILKKIESNINPWYANVTRQLDAQYKELKEPLKELNRETGVKRGENWVSPEGTSGLRSNQEVKVIEHMTDRPYYIAKDGQSALNAIKNSPYSGIMSSSVSDKEVALHAQYIVDIKPVTITENGKSQTKDAVFYDNTWGPYEHDNTWVDENGLMRTDYNNDYGSASGYITDNNYRTGDVIENLLYKPGEKVPEIIENKIYKKLEGDSASYKFPMMTDIIAPGTYPNTSLYVQMIRQNTLVSPTRYIEDLEKYAHQMSKSEIKSKIKKLNDVNANVEKIYDKYIKKIEGIQGFDKGITTIEEYNELPDNSELKILLQKIAIMKSYPGISENKMFERESSFDDLKKLKEKIKIEANKNFDYTFSKTPDIAKYGVESIREPLYDMLDEFAKNNNINMPDGIQTRIVNSIKNINKSDFDGNLSHTIDLMANNFKNSINKNTSDFENKQLKTEAFTNAVKGLLEQNMKFNVSDISKFSGSGKFGCIANWIDNNYNPATDEEFAKIFNDIQNMTLSEFNEKVKSKISDKDLGIKPITGYDILKQLNAQQDNAHDSLYNTIWSQAYTKNFELSKTTPAFEYNKFSKRILGLNYVNGQRSFDDIYFDYYYSTKSMSFGKIYDRMTNDAFKKYGSFPAYPKVNPEDKEELENSMQSLYNNISDEMESIVAYKAQIRSLDIVKHLRNYTNKLDSNAEITTRQRNFIEKDLKEFIDINYGDETIRDSLNSINNILKTGKTASDYQNLANSLAIDLLRYEKTIDGSTMDEAIKNSLASINESKKGFIRNIIDPKYQKDAFELLNKWISSKSKAVSYKYNSEKRGKEADNYYAKFVELFEKHRIYKTPEKVFEEFLLVNAKDAKPFDLNAKGDKAIQTVKEFEELKNTYKTALRGLLYNANNLEMQYILMNCAKNGSTNAVAKALKNSKLQLKNGDVVSMDSDDALNIMLAPMLGDSDLDTAVMFIEQLGLSERVIQLASKGTTFDTARKTIKRIHSILSSVSKQAEIVKQEMKSLEDIDNYDTNYIEKINQSKENILRKTKNTNYKVTVDIFQKAMENAIEQIKNQPEMSRSAILYSNMNMATTAAQYVATENIKNLNAKLMRFQIIHDLILRLSLPADSPAVSLREKYINDFNSVEDYRNSLAKRYDSLNLVTS